MRSLCLGLMVLSLVFVAHAQAPVVNSGGVVNAGSYAAQGVAPGSVVSIFGTNLASGVVTANKIPLPTTLGDVVSVTFNNVPAPLFFVGPLQINAQLPWNVLPSGSNSGTVNVVVTRSTGSSQPQSVQVVPAMPGIFTTTQNGLGQAIATDNADGAIAAPVGSLKSASHPIGIGDYLIVWCTGMGPVNPPIANGANSSDGLRTTVATPAVLIGGVPAKFIYSVLSLQYVAENQIGVQVAEGTPTGDAVPLQIQVNGVTTSNNVTIAVATGTTQPALFNTLAPAIAIFDPGAGALSGLPSVKFSNGTSKPSAGYQGGDLVNGKVLYYPWAVTSGGTSSLTSSITSSIPHGVIVSYDANVTDFTNPSNWKYFDMTTLATPGAGNAKGYNGAAIGNNNRVYLVPDGHQAGSLPTFVEYDAGKAVNDPSGYQTLGAPERGGALGNTYGWCTGVFDGVYVYYVPDQDEILGLNGNVVRYNTTAAFDLESGGWAHFDMTTVNPLAEGFQSGAYDGHRFVYYVPFRSSVIVRYDTQFGSPGTPNPGGFTNAAAYKTLNPTQLGIGENPPITGNGQAASLAGFTGAQVVWDGSHTNEYLYLIPWATYPDNSGNPHLMSTTARVRIGTQSGAAWSYVDITGTDTPATAAPNWEVFDLSTLPTNPQWAMNGWPYPAVWTAPSVLAGQSQIAGWQLSWLNTSGPNPRVGYGANISNYWVEHDVSHALADPTGWYVAPTSQTLKNGTFGGAYDPAHQIFYPASPSTPLIQATGL